jgi:hypothetical protein
MRFYITLRKIEETDSCARYEFVDELDGGTGIVEIRKSDGHVFEIESPSQDKSELFYERCAWALVKNWRKGECPELTGWVS